MHKFVDPKVSADWILHLMKVWGEERGIQEHSTPEAQFEVLKEEFAELEEQIAAMDVARIADEGCDIIVVLVQIFAFFGIDVNESLQLCLEKINQRTGSFNEAGKWVKDA